MKNQDLGSSNFPRMISRVIKLTVAQLLPISIRQSIPVSKCRPNVSSVVGIRGLRLLFARKNRPIYHGTVSNHLLNSMIEQSKNSRRPAKTSSDHKHFTQGHAKAPFKRQLSKLF